MSNAIRLQKKKNRMKKVLMVAHVFPPFRSVGHSIRAVKFIKYLPASGWLPVVLTIDERKEYFDYLKEGSVSLLSEISNNVSVYRAPAGEPSLEYLEREKKFGQRNWATAIIVKVFGGVRRWLFRNLVLPDRRVTWLPFALGLGRRIVKKEGIDVIFSTCPPHSATLVGAFLKKLTGKPLVLDFRDDWIDTPWHHSRPSLVQRIERWMENWVVRAADKVILVTEWSRNAFLSRYPEQPVEKFVYVPNGCDLEEFTALPLRKSISRNRKFTIVHAGSLNDSENWMRSPETFFRALYNVFQTQPALKEQIVTSFTGSFPESQRKLVDKLGLSGVVKELGFLPRDDWGRYLKSSDLLLVINYDGFSTLIPGKIYEYWAIGGPPILLISCRGAATEFVKQHNLGFSADPHDVAGIERAILEVYVQSKTNSPIEINTEGVEAFDRRSLSRQLADLLTGLLESDNMASAGLAQSKE